MRYHEQDEGYAEMQAHWQYQQMEADNAAAQAEYEESLAEEDARQMQLRSFAGVILKNFFNSDPFSDEVDDKCLAENYIQLVMYAIDETAKELKKEVQGYDFNTKTK